MNVDELIARVDEELTTQNANPYLLDILRSLEQIRQISTASFEDRSRIASGLERLILEDFSFSESELGGNLLAFADRYVEKGLS